jgi:mRNA interferase HigB
MRLIKRKVLQDFAEKHPQTKAPLGHWRQLVKAGVWESPSDVKQVFGSNVDFMANDRAIFNIKGNDYRLIAEINYKTRIVYVRFMGTHAEYDKVDAGSVKVY